MAARDDFLMLHAVSDGMIALAYYSIALSLLYFTWRRTNLVYRWMYLLFGIFILADATVHLFDIVSPWHSPSMADGAVRAVTALAAIATAGLFWCIMPRATTIPGREEIEAEVRERTAELETALQQKELFVREIHHRVKNNLQIVVSLLNLQIGTARPELRGYLDGTLSRIRSIGLVHEQLYRSNTASIELKDYLGHLFAQVSDIHGGGPRTVQWTVEGDSLVVDVDRAVPIGLICNEVLSNAFKHAFAEDRPGAIELRIADEGSLFRISIHDNGVGLPPDFLERASRSMGIQVVRGLTAQIGGTSDFLSENGTKFVLSVPRLESARA